MKRKRWVAMSCQVRKPSPPTTISNMTATFNSGSPTKPVREEKGACTPIRSKPALQKAETEWNTAYQSPLGPMRGQKSRASTTAPAASMAKAVFRMKSVMRTMPPTWGAEMDSCMTQRCFKPMRLPENMKMASAMVTTPMPPT